MSDSTLALVAAVIRALIEEIARQEREQ